MRAAILAGGLGMRLRPLTEEVPKPLLPIGRKPIMQLLVEKLSDEGFKEIFVALGYGGDLIESYFGDGSEFGVRMHYSREQEPLGTAGPIRIMDLPEDEPILCVNGDVLTKTSFAQIMQHHSESQADMTIGAVPYRFQVAFGVIDCDGDRVCGVQEKPEIRLDTFAGITALSWSAIEQIPEGRPYDMTDLIQDFATNGRKVIRHRISEFWIDIGKHDEYERANELIQRWDEL